MLISVFIIKGKKQTMNRNYKRRTQNRINKGITSDDLKDKCVLEAIKKQWDNSSDSTIRAPYSSKVQLRSVTIWSLTAAATIALLTVLSYFFTNKSSSTHEEDFVCIYTDEPIKHILPDSSTVWLASNSMISYYKPFASRELNLIGHATFNVKPCKTNSFKVFSPKSTIEVLGTTFTVDNSKSNYEIHLYSGAINLYFDEQIVNIQPNEKVILNTDSFAYSLESDSTIQWREDQFRFKNITLINLLLFIKTTFNYEIELQQPHLSTLKFTGAIFYNETIDEIIQKISFTLNLDFTKVSNTKYTIN